MSKVIKITPDLIADIKESFSQAISGARMSDGKFSFHYSFDKVERKASLCFTEMAWLKMMTLVYGCDKEIAWHGVVTRGEDDSYVVTDILVYPQSITGVTVESDDDAYPLWYAKLTDKPEVFENLRMQGHSHVNMATTPSTTDLDFYKKILEHVGEEDFYVFIIVNKKGEKTIKIYDFAKNVLFETSDVDVSIIDDGAGMNEFLEDAKAMVRVKYAAPTKTSGYNTSYANSYSGGSGYGGYSAQSQKAGQSGSYGYGYTKKVPVGQGKKSSKYTADFTTGWDYDDF